MPEITIGRLRGGYCVSWSDPQSGKRRRFQLAARTRKEAEAEGRDRYLKESVGSQDMTTADLWGLYVDHLGTKPTAKTMRFTGKAVLKHFGELFPRQVTDTDCTLYAEARIAGGKSIGTVHTELGHLRSCYRWAAKRHLIPFAPHVAQPPKPDSHVEPLTDAEARDLINACKAPHVRLAVVLLFATAARVGAILDLTWDRVDFDRGVINLRLPDGVTRKGRAVVPMNRMARVALEAAHKARLSDYVIEVGGDAIKSIRTGFAASVARAGIDRRVSIHDIRHTAAVKMLAAGVDIERVAQYLGHSNSSVTRRTYARFLPEHLSDAADILNFMDGPRAT